MRTSKVIMPTRCSLTQEIKTLKKPTKETIKKLYGDFGVDIYEGKKQPTILTEKERKRNIFDKIKTWFTGVAPDDYEEGDSLFDVVFKYVGNKKVGLEKDIEEKFGKEGIKKLRSLQRLGYVEI